MKETSQKQPQDDIELTGEDIVDEPALEDIEDLETNKLKQLQAKVKACEEEKRQTLEDLQRAKAEFLNSRRRLEEEKLRDRSRTEAKHIERLLPLVDSFQMAMSNAAVWEAVDGEWRKGVESIYTQLQKILASYDVSEINPLGATFNPEQHEAMNEVPVTNQKDDHKVVTVLQPGFVRTIAGKEELIRPARVSVGVFQEHID